MIHTIYIINGPNLNLLGRRDVDIYGSKSFEVYLSELRNEFPQIAIEYFQTNHEGAIIDLLHEIGFNEHIGIVLNGGGLSHTSISLRDAVAVIPAPVAEVHISNIFKREHFRWNSYLTEVSVAHYIGKGIEGYKMAIEFLLKS